MTKPMILAKLVMRLVSIVLDCWVSYYIGKRFGSEVGVVCVFVLLSLSAIASHIYDIKEKLDER